MMPWYADADIPIDKPKEIRELENMGENELNSMPPRERDHKIEEAALSLANEYKREDKSANFEGCTAIVSAALSVTGNSLGGEFGAFMVGRSEVDAQHVCRRLFIEDNS